MYLIRTFSLHNIDGPVYNSIKNDIITIQPELTGLLIINFIIISAQTAALFAAM